MIQTLISMLDAAIAQHLPTVKRHGLAELQPVDGGTQPVVYADNGSFVQIASDNSGTFSYWRMLSAERTTSVEIPGQACDAFVVTIPLRFVAMVDRTLCPQVQDAARAGLWAAIDADDSIRSVTRAISIDFNSTGVDADSRKVYQQEFGRPLENASKAWVAIDMSVVVTGNPECFDPCDAVGDFFCAMIQKRTWAQVQACLTEAQEAAAIAALCDVGPCDPFTATLGGHQIIDEADPCGETVALTCSDTIDAPLVSDAIEDQKNGLYTANGQVNGRTSYELLPNHVIEWNGSQYILRDIFVGTDWITNNAPATPWAGVWVEFVGGAPIEATITQGTIGDICPCGDVEIIDQDLNVIATPACGSQYSVLVFDGIDGGVSNTVFTNSIVAP